MNTIPWEYFVIYGIVHYALCDTLLFICHSIHLYAMRLLYYDHCIPKRKSFDLDGIDVGQN